MPIYEYQCTQCKQKVQKLQRVNEDSTGEKCPNCKKGELKKVFSVFATVPESGAGSCPTGTCQL